MSIMSQTKLQLEVAAKNESYITLTPDEVGNLSRAIGDGAYKIPVCVPCRVNFRPEENGVYMVEMFMNPPQPYKIWAADMWRCPGCDTEILKGFSRGALEHFENGFQTEYNRICTDDKKTVFHVFEHVGDATKYGEK